MVIGLIGCVSPVKAAEVFLFDVHGLYGGRNIWITKDRTIHVQKVYFENNIDYKLKEALYKWQLTEPQFNELNDLIREADLKNLKMVKRLGVPDETYHLLYVRENAQEDEQNDYVIFKWADDRNSRFDKVYSFLIMISNSTKFFQPYQTGYYAHKYPAVAKEFPTLKKMLKDSE